MKLNIYLLVLLLFNVSSLSLRQLSSDKDFCSNVDIEYKSTNLTFSQYVSQTIGNSTDLLDFFKRILVDHTDIDFILILRKIGIYVCVFMFTGIVLICWVCFGLCCLCDCCLFKKKRSKRSNCFKLSLFGLLVSLFAASFLAVQSGPEFNNYFSGSVCSFIKVFDHTLEGDFRSSEDLPRWIGLNNVEPELDNLLDEMNVIMENLSNESTTFETDISDYSEQFQTLLDTNLTINVSNPMGGEELVSADYSIAFPLFLEEVRNQYSQIKDLFSEGINLIKSKIDDFSSFNDTLKETSKQIITQVTSTSDSITSFRDKVSYTTMNITEYVLNNQFDPLQLIFGVFIFFAAIGLMIIIIYSCLQRAGACKCIVYLLWIVSMLFMVGCLIIGSILGILGTILSESAIVLPHVYTDDFLSQEEFIKTFGDFREAVPYIEICLEGNGDVVSELGYDFELEGVETIIDESRTKIDEFKNYIQENSNIEQLQTFITLIQSYHDDYSLAFSQIDPRIFPLVIANLNSKFSTVASDYNDVFVTNQKDCPGDSTYLSPNETRETKGKYCLVVHEWKPEQIEIIYSELNELITAFKNLYTFIQDHNRVTGEMLNNTLTMDSILHSMINSSLVLCDHIKDSITSVEIFYETNMVNETALINKVNCAYIKDDLITFVKQLFIGFANQSSKIGNFSIICSIIAYFVLLMLIVLTHSTGANKQDVDSNNRSDRLQESMLIDY